MFWRLITKEFFIDCSEVFDVIFDRFFCFVLPSLIVLLRNVEDEPFQVEDKQLVLGELTVVYAFLIDQLKFIEDLHTTPEVYRIEELAKGF